MLSLSRTFAFLHINQSSMKLFFWAELRFLYAFCFLIYVSLSSRESKDSYFYMTVRRRIREGLRGAPASEKDFVQWFIIQLTSIRPALFIWLFFSLSSNHRLARYLGRTFWFYFSSYSDFTIVLETLLARSVFQADTLPQVDSTIIVRFQDVGKVNMHERKEQFCRSLSKKFS